MLMFSAQEWQNVERKMIEHRSYKRQVCKQDLMIQLFPGFQENIRLLSLFLCCLFFFCTITLSLALFVSHHSFDILYNLIKLVLLLLRYYMLIYCCHHIVKKKQHFDIYVNQNGNNFLLRLSADSTLNRC